MFFRFYDSICSRQLPNRTTTQDFPVNLCHRYSVFDCKRRMKVILFGFTLWLSSEETGWSVFKVSWWFPWLWIVTWFSIECLNTYPCFWAEEPPEISLCWIESYPCITSAVSLVFIHFYHTWTLVFPLKINLELICPIQNYFKQSFIPTGPEFSQALSRWWCSYIFYFHNENWGFMIQVDLHICFEWVVRNPPTNSDAVIKSISPVDIGKSPVIYRL